MKDENKTKAQFETELARLRRRIAALETTRAAHKQMEREIEERQLYLESVLACAPDAIVTLDAQHKVQEWNSGAEKLFGYSAAEATGRNLDLLVAGPDTDVFEEAGELTRAVLAGQHIPPTNATRYRKNGSPVNVILSAAPILLENDVVGVVAVYTNVTEQIQAEETLRRKVEQLTALSQASHIVVSSLQIDQVLAAILSLAGQVTASDYATVFLVDEAGHVGQSAENLPGVPSIEYRVRDNGLTDWIVRSSQAVIVDEIGADGTMIPHLGAKAPRLANPHIVATGIKSLAGLPLIARQSLLGVLYLHSERPAAFHDQLSLLTTFADQAAVAIENAQLYQTLRQELAERRQAEEEIRQKSQDLTLINMMNEAVNRDESLPEMIQLLSREMNRIFSGSGATVYLVSKDKKQLVMQNLALPPAIVGRLEKLTGTKMPAISIPLQPGSLYLEMLRAGQPQIINDSAKIKRLIAEFAETIHLPPQLHRLLRKIIQVLDIQSIINIPLISDGEAIGLLAVSSAEPFTEVDLRRLETIARQLTAIIEHQQAEKALRASEEYTRNIIASSLDMIIAVDMERRITGFNRAAQETLGYCPEEILGKHIDILYADPQEGLRLHQTTIEKGKCVQEVSSRRKNGAVFPALISASVLRDAHGEMVGVMGISRDVTARKQAEKALHKKTNQQEKLLEAARHLTQSLDFKTVLAQIGTMAKEMLEADGCAIYLLEPDSSVLTPVTAIEPPYEKAISATPLDVETSLVGQAIKSRRGLIFNDTPVDGIPDQQTSSIPPKEEERIIVAPFVIDDSVLGAICLNRVGALFSTEELALVETFATYAAAVLKNAQAHDELRREIKERQRVEKMLRRRNLELALLNRVSKALTSTLDLGRVISMMLEEVRRLLDTVACSAWLVDKKTNELVCLESTGPKSRIVRSWRLSPGEGIAGWAVLHGQSLIVADAWTDERYFDGVDRQTELGLRSILTVPLQAKERVIGVLQVLDTEANRFSEADLELLEPLVASAAIAIENARLYEETAHRLAQTEVLREMMLAAASTLNFDQVLERMIAIIKSRLNVEYFSFMLPDEEGKFMQSHPAVLGYTLHPGGVFRFPLDRCVTGRVYRTGQPVILPDVREAADYAVANENVRSELAVPVRVGDEVVAVLNFESSKLNAFGEDELEFYTAVAGQLGMAMDNARLYEQARRDAEIKSTLLREVNHRVKNNLTAIIGLLRAEPTHAGVQEQAVYQSIMQNLVNRVQGLATVHSMLSASEWTPLPLHELAVQVIHSSLQMLPREKHISVEVTPSPVRVTSDQAHDLALIINELATNTVKHGMPGRDTARITVNITLEGNTVVFEFRNDGPGYPDSVLQQKSSNVGFDLIRNIVRRNLDGELALYNDHGAVAVTRFELLVMDD